jgi:hypothetical protein
MIHIALVTAIRHLHRIPGLTGRTIEDTERLMRLIQDAEKNVLAARAAEKGGIAAVNPSRPPVP